MELVDCVEMSTQIRRWLNSRDSEWCVAEEEGVGSHCHSNRNSEFYLWIDPLWHYWVHYGRHKPWYGGLTYNGVVLHSGLISDLDHPPPPLCCVFSYFLFSLPLCFPFPSLFSPLPSLVSTLPLPSNDFFLRNLTSIVKRTSSTMRCKWNTKRGYLSLNGYLYMYVY